MGEEIAFKVVSFSIGHFKAGQGIFCKPSHSQWLGDILQTHQPFHVVFSVQVDEVGLIIKRGLVGLENEILSDRHHLLLCLFLSTVYVFYAAM